MNTTIPDRRWMHRLKYIESLYLSPELSDKAGKAQNDQNYEIEYFPCVYIDAVIDFNDIRTGYKGAEKLARALKIYDTHAVMGWAEEIILDANVDRIQEIMPPNVRLDPLPEFADDNFVINIKNRYIEHLTRSWKKILYRNSELDIYSCTGESREEFIIRCREQFLEQMRIEIEQLRVIFNRMQEQLKEKYLGIVEEELSESMPLTPDATDRDIYSRYAEHIAGLFLNAVSSATISETAKTSEVDIPRIDKKSELEERLIALTAESRQKIALLRESYEKKMDIVDEYILRPNLKNIHCERSCILWMPRKG